MKTKYLTVYDYGTGGVWTYINARSADEIKKRFPELVILENEPTWFKGRKMQIRSYDIDDEPDEFLKMLMG